MRIAAASFFRRYDKNLSSNISFWYLKEQELSSWFFRKDFKQVLFQYIASFWFWCKFLWPVCQKHDQILFSISFTSFSRQGSRVREWSFQRKIEDIIKDSEPSVIIAFCHERMKICEQNITWNNNCFSGKKDKNAVCGMRRSEVNHSIIYCRVYRHSVPERNRGRQCVFLQGLFGRP